VSSGIDITSIFEVNREYNIINKTKILIKFNRIVVF
jgi:hypothetical protein